MTKREVCLHNKVEASWSLYGYYALEVHHIEHGIEEYFYCHCTNGDTYHKLKVYTESSKPYVLFKNKRLYLADCERVCY